MAIQISGTTVIDNSRNLTNIASIFSCTGIASKAEAEAGTSSTKLMTPLRVAQAIAALAGGSVIKSIQRGVITTISQSSYTVTISSVDTSKTMLNHIGGTAFIGSQYSDTTRLTLTNSTTITMNRYTASGASQTHYEVIEFV